MTDSPKKQLFSIMIPTWNNLPFLKLCVSGLEKHSTFRHQILVFVNDGSDGTLEWVKERRLSYLRNTENVGICRALNSLRRLVDTEYILYLNDDMYVCPRWDEYLWEEIKKLPDERFSLSSTMIQPKSSYIATAHPSDFGTTPETFDEGRLLREYDKLHFSDWMGATWPPNLVHRNLWDEVGGYSLEYFPGMYSDPDFSAKLWMAGVRYFRGVAASRVYHFEQASTGRIRKNDGSTQFLQKWGLTSSTFVSCFLHRGEPFDETRIGKVSPGLRLHLMRSRLKGVWHAGRNAMLHKLWSDI